ncbi:MAG: glycosyltransferase family 4 protein [Sphingomicrobium sp.]
MKAPRLLLVVNVDWFFVSHRLPIAEAAIREGYEVHLACACTGLKEELEARGLIVHELRLGRRDLSLPSLGGGAMRIAALLRSIEPDIVHLITIKPVLLGGIAARLSGVKNVLAAISGLGYVFISQGISARVRRALVSFLYRLALGSRHVVAVFQNPTDAAEVCKIAGLRPEQVKIIRGSGVNLEQLSVKPLIGGDTVLTFAGRLLIDKGLREFIAAACMLKAQGVEARFLVAGDPDPDNPSSVDPAELERWREEGVVELIGYQDEIGDLFARSHAVVLPSYREGLPKTLAEAAACGRAVVTTDVPGCRDAVIPDESALLVPPMTVEPLAMAMKQLIEDRELCAAMGRAGRKLAEDAFGIDRVVDAHLSIYAEMLERGL